MSNSQTVAAISPSLQTQIVAAVSRHLAGRRYRLYLFGSRAQGTATPRSDYDVGIESETPLPLAMMECIRAELDELPIMQRIELVDLTAASPDFVQRALATSEVLDERS